MATTEARLRERVARELGIDESEITADASLGDDLGADSIDHVEIVMCAEEEFDVAIDDDVADQIVTFGDLLRVVEARLRQKAGAA